MVSSLAQRVETSEARVLPTAATQGAHVQMLTYDPLASLQEKPMLPGAAGELHWLPEIAREKTLRPPGVDGRWHQGPDLRSFRRLL